MGTLSFQVAHKMLVMAIVLFSATGTDGNRTTSASQDVGERQLATPMFRAVGRIVSADELDELEQETTADALKNLTNTSLADIESDNLTQSLQLRHRERKRQERLLVIQTQILQRLRFNRQPNITKSAIFSEEEQKRIVALVEKMHNISHSRQHDVSDFTEYSQEASHRIETMQKLQSFYPSCLLYNNTDKQVWDKANSLRVYYDIPFYRYSVGGKIVRAKLRIFKIAPVKTEERDLYFTTQYSHFDATAIDERFTTDLTVSIYQFVKPPRFNHKDRKRLVESRRISLNQEGWVEFNVITSVNQWLRKYNKNFGFDIEVKDTFGNELDPNIYFRNINCSTEDSANQDPPFPNIMELHPEMGENETSLFDNETYPTLDLQVIDFEIEEGRLNLQNVPSSIFSSKHSINKRNTNSKLHSDAYCLEETEYFTFSEMGLDSVILYPNGFHWTFCSGLCKHSKPYAKPFSTNETKKFNSSIWRLILAQTVGIKDSRCVAASYESLTLLYNNIDDGILTKTLPNFLPRRCSCSSS